MHSPLAQQDIALLGPQCPHCLEPITANYLFCRACGASLIFPEFDRSFCPFCGIRVSERQEFCHECCGHLMPEEKKVQETKRSQFLKRFSYKFGPWKRKHTLISLIISSLIFASIAYLVLNKTAILDIRPNKSTEKLHSQDIMVAKKTSPNPSIFQKTPVSVPLVGLEAPVDTQLSQLLNQIREAQLQKNIELFMSSFSAKFPQLEEKRLTALKIWQLYDYIDMKFEIKDIKKQDNNNASAIIYWQIEAKKRSTGIIKHFNRSYYVSFSKEGDKWFIKDM